MTTFVIALAALLGCGADPGSDPGVDAGAQVDAGSLPRPDAALEVDGGGEPAACVEGAVTSTCRCGSEIVDDGFCCDGAAYEAGCPPECTADSVPGSVVYFVSPEGDDESEGSFDAPLATLEEAISRVEAGQSIVLRGGTYAVTESIRIAGRSGTEDQPIRLWSCPGEHAVIDFGGAVDVNDGIRFTGDWWHFKGLEVTNLRQHSSGTFTVALRVVGSSHNVFEQLDMHHNGGSGLHISGDSTGNLVLDSDFHHNYDPLTPGDPGENADGFAIAYIPSTATNTVRGCRAWRNSDDGLDLWLNQGTVVLEDSWAFDNGYVLDTDERAGNGNGFKLGGMPRDTSHADAPRIIRRCIAFGNPQRGFDQNGVPLLVEGLNNTAYGNGHVGFGFGWDFGLASVFRNNISYANTSAPYSFSPAIVHTSNSWNEGHGVSDADFASLDSSCMDDPRSADGSLPTCDFLRLAPTSPLIDAGADVGLSYEGDAPDLGARETE